MNAAVQLLERAKRKTGKTESALAKKINVTQSAFSNLKRPERGGPDAYIVYRLAELAGERPDKALAKIEAEKEKDPKKRAYWEKFLRPRRSRLNYYGRGDHD